MQAAFTSNHDFRGCHRLPNVPLRVLGHVYQKSRQAVLGNCNFPTPALAPSLRPANPSLVDVLFSSAARILETNLTLSPMAAFRLATLRLGSALSSAFRVCKQPIEASRDMPYMKRHRRQSERPRLELIEPIVPHQRAISSLATQRVQNAAHHRTASPQVFRVTKVREFRV